MNTEKKQDITDLTYDAAYKELEKLVLQNAIVPLGPENKARLDFLEEFFMEN